MPIATKEGRFPGRAGGEIRYLQWIPPEPRAAVQLMHGFFEHIARYDRLANALAEAGILVYGMDVAGHGKSVRDGRAGSFGEERGWEAAVEDMHALRALVGKNRPAIPFILLGHSLGALLAQSFVMRYPNDFDGYILSGMPAKPLLLPYYRKIARDEMKKLGGGAAGKRLQTLLLKRYNRKIPRPRTEWDWLSSAAEQVDAFLADPLCGFPYTAGSAYDILNALKETTKRAWAARTPNKPMLLLGGAQDPVGLCGKGPKRAYRRLKRAGRVTEITLYPLCRHALLFERESERVCADILLLVEAVSAMGEYSQ